MQLRVPMFWSTALTQLLVVTGCTEASPPEPSLISLHSGTTVRLQAVSVIDENIVWASGLEGTVVRTTDGGANWTVMRVPGADSLQFRDVDAIDAQTAFLLSSGGGSDSRIYKTTDGGVTWALQFINRDSTGFFDCMGIWDADHGAVYGDAVDGLLVILTTRDGHTWTRVPEGSLPEAQPGEGGFAASGSCVTTFGDSTGWIGTGASTDARILKTTDRGNTWSAYRTPIISGSGSSGITTVGFYDALHGIAAGGEISDPESHTDNVAVTFDGGETWSFAGRLVFPGAVYGIAVVPSSPTPTVVAVGPGGADYSLDNGATWHQLDSLEYWSVAFANPRAGWAVGPSGRITKISFSSDNP